jgi:hypothetical protein
MICCNPGSTSRKAWKPGFGKRHAAGWKTDPTGSCERLGPLAAARQTEIETVPERRQKKAE